MGFYLLLEKTDRLRIYYNFFQTNPKVRSTVRDKDLTVPSIVSSIRLKLGISQCKCTFISANALEVISRDAVMAGEI